MIFELNNPPNIPINNKELKNETKNENDFFGLNTKRQKIIQKLKSILKNIPLKKCIILINIISIISQLQKANTVKSGFKNN